MRTQRLQFSGHNGAQLAARLDLPVGKPAAFALFAHCFTCSKDIAAARQVALRLSSLGIAVLRFDFTGLGHSDGEFAHTNFSSNAADIVLAAEYLRQNFQAPSILIGHSLGGSAILHAASEIPEAKAVVTIGSPADPAHVVENFSEKIPEIEQKGAAQVSLAGRQFSIERQFIEDVSAQNLERSVRGLRKALLVLHSPLDTTVDIDNAAQIFQWAKHPKSFITLDEADHLLSKSEQAHYAAELIATWVQRYVDIRVLPAPVSATEGAVIVRESDPQGFLQDISAGGHHLLADEPIDYGGSYLGATPYQLVSAGLGACTSMTIRMYARRKQLKLAHVEVKIRHEKIDTVDSGNISDTTQPENNAKMSAKLDQFVREITLIGELSELEKQRLLEIADRCPVHRTLEGQVRVLTELNAEVP